MIWDRDISEKEFKERILYSLMIPVVKMARFFGASLKRVTELVRVAYFHELREEDMTLSEIGEALDISVPTASRLSKRLKSNFWRPELEHQLPRRIEFMLWAEPLSRARISQVLPDYDEDEVNEVIDEMIADNRIEKVSDEPEKFGLVEPEEDFVEDEWFARIGSLNSLLENLSDTVRDRFFNDESRSFARTVSFHMEEGRIDELEAMFEEEIVQRLIEYEEDAKEVEDVADVKLSLFWHPEFDGE